jgi:hypothetical protein
LGGPTFATLFVIVRGVVPKPHPYKVRLTSRIALDLRAIGHQNPV